MRLTRLRLLAGLVALAGLLAGCVQGADPDLEGTTTTIIAVRHGDRNNSLEDRLNEKGHARAQALAAALKGTRIDAIYIPDTQRNRETAAPLAAARGLKPRVVPTTNLAGTLLSGNAGKTVLWIGNKPNLSALWTSLKAKDPPPLDYGDLFIVQVEGRTATRVRRRHFGD